MSTTFPIAALIVSLQACAPMPAPKPPILPAPPVRAVGLLVQDGAGRGVAGVRCLIDDTGGPQTTVTTETGYGVWLTVSATLRDTQVTCSAVAGYLPASKHRRLLTDGNEDLEPLILAWVPRLRPTREQRLAVRADFAFTEVSGQNSEWQTYAYAGWSDVKRAEARARWTRIGMTHVAISWALNYPAAGPPFDFRSHPQDFVVRLKELRADGFVIVLAASQEEAYGKYSGFDLAQNLMDIARWPEWGWTDYIDVCWVGWESNDFMTLTPRAPAVVPPLQHVAILRQLRAVLGPEAVLAVQPGRIANEGLIYVGNPDHDREAFWREMHAPAIALDVFFFEPPTAVFEGEDWRERLYAALMGASARIWRRIDPVPTRFPFEPFARTDVHVENWTRSAPIDGGGVPLVYWEGPAYLRWSSAQKNEAARVAMMVPGVIGSGDGIP